MNGKATESGISIARIDKLMVDLLDFAERNNKIVNQIELLVRDSANYFISPAGERYRKNLSEYCSEAKTINKNILTYKDDLLKIKGKYRSMEEAGAQMMIEALRESRFKERTKEEK